MSTAMIDEKVYRQLVDQVFSRIDAAFEQADPDLAESALSQGTLTITFKNQYRFIVSPQTPVRQIWVAYRDRAWHFDLNESTKSWTDDRGQCIDLFQLVQDTTLQASGVEVAV
jgi:CyaY protein